MPRWRYHVIIWLQQTLPILAGICAWLDWAQWSFCLGAALCCLCAGRWQALAVPAVWAFDVWLWRQWRRENL